MPGVSALRSARARRVGQLTVGALSLVAGTYAAVRVIAGTTMPPSPLDAPPQGPLADLLTLHLPWPLWQMLARVTAVAASAGLLAAGIGLLLASRCALRAGLWGLMPEFAVRVLLVPGRVALIAYPGGVSLAAPGLERPARQVSMLVAAGFIVCALLYLGYLLWLRRELARMPTSPRPR